MLPNINWRSSTPWAGLALLSLAAMLASPDLAHAQNASAHVTLDPTFRTPAPPGDAFPQNPQHVFVGTMAMLIAGLAMSGVAVFDSFRLKTTVPLGILLGAAVCVIPESVDNYLAGCFWTTSHDPKNLLYFLMGREFEYYVAVMWWTFGAILGYVFYKGLQANLTTGRLWALFAVSGAADIIIEESLLRYGGIYTYFGHHPLVLLGYFPWWWLFANVSALYLSMALAYRFRDWFNGWKCLFIGALVPLCYIGGFAFTALPTIFVIQGDFSPLVTQAAGILTCILSLIMTGGIFYLVLGRNPLAFAEREKPAPEGAAAPTAALGAPALQH